MRFFSECTAALLLRILIGFVFAFYGIMATDTDLGGRFADFPAAFFGAWLYLRLLILLSTEIGRAHV